MNLPQVDYGASRALIAAVRVVGMMGIVYAVSVGISCYLHKAAPSDFDIGVLVGVIVSAFAVLAVKFVRLWD